MLGGGVGIGIFFVLLFVFRKWNVLNIGIFPLCVLKTRYPTWEGKLTSSYCANREYFQY